MKLLSAMVRGNELEKLRPWRFWEQNIRKREKFLDRVEKDGETEGERETEGEWEIIKKKRIKILKKEYLNEVVKKNRMFDVWYIVK